MSRLSETFRRFAENPQAYRDADGLPMLHAAASAGDLDAVKTALAIGVNVDARDAQGMTALRWAIRTGHTEVASYLVRKAGADATLGDNDNVTPLHSAAWNGHTETARLLLVYGADVNVESKHKQTPLHLAAHQGRNATARLLIEKGAQPDRVDKDGALPLHFTVQENHGPVLDTLIEAGAAHYINKPSAFRRLSPLHCAVEQGKTDMVAKLLEAGADPNVADEDGLTPLHRAAERGQVEMLRLLVEKGGADINKVGNDRKRTAVHMAAWYRRDDALAYLLQRGGDPDQPDADGRTALDISAYQGDLDGVMLLHGYGAAIDKPEGAPGNTALMEAVFFEHEDVVEYLLKHAQADVNHTGPSGNTALHAALNNHNDVISALLLKAGANPNAMNAYGRTPLALAVMHASRTVVGLLLQNGANPNVGRDDAWPLHISVDRGDELITRMLLAKGADRNRLDDQGRTAYQCAREKGKTELLEPLRPHGIVVQAPGNSSKRRPRP